MKALDTKVDERELIAAAQQDPARFAEMYELHFERVYAYIARRVRDRSVTEELTSHVFHQALASLGKFKWRGAPFAAWLFRIAANSIADSARKRAREAADHPTALAAESEPDFEQIERIAQVYRLVEKLPWDQRHVIRMRFSEEKNIREIANQMSRSEGAIKQLQFRALQTLRALLSEPPA